jgi:LacI family transcriptional regulator
MSATERATIRDVARRAKVSVATVSRVLNGKESVDGQLRNRVLAAVKELDFRANRLARSFRRRTTQSIALVIPDIKNFFFAAVSHEIEEEAFRQGYNLLICNTSDDLERQAKYFELLTEEAVAGIVICTANEHRAHVEVQRALERGVAVVAIDRRLENVPIDLVLSDNFGGARLATTHLLTLGHRRIAVITGSDDFAPARERRIGFEQALRDHGLLVDPELVKVTDFRHTGAEAATHELWALQLPPTAILICSGNQAIGALRALNSVGARLPEDVSIVVFDDLEWASAFHPPITAVEQNFAQIGATAVKMLLQRIKSPGVAVEERRVPTRLHVRQSSAPPHSAARSVVSVNRQEADQPVD